MFRALIVVGAVFTFENYIRCASVWTLADAVFSQRFQVRLIAKAGRIAETRHAPLSAQQIANKVASQRVGVDIHFQHAIAANGSQRMRRGHKPDSAAEIMRAIAFS